MIHRDYFEKGANVMVEMFGDRIEITNPGGLVKGLTPENFGKISMLRNPGIANLFQRIDYIEKMGTGIERIRRALKEAKVPQIQYEFMPYFVKAVFPRPEEVTEIAPQVTGEVTGEVAGEVTGEVRRLLTVIEGEMKRIDIQKALNLKHEDYFREAYLTPAVKQGLLEMTIPDKPRSSKQRYRLTEKGKRLMAGLIK